MDVVVPAQPSQQQLSCIQALRRLFLVLSDSQFESGCEMERQRRRRSRPECHSPKAQSQSQQQQQQTALVDNHKDSVATTAVADAAATNPVDESAATTTTNAAAVTATATMTIATAAASKKQSKNDLNWDIRYRQLELFKTQYHHLNVPTPAKDADFKALYTWMHTQREAWQKSLMLLKKQEGQGQGVVDTRGCLSQDRIDRLIQLGMGTREHGPANALQDVHDASFESHFQQLVAYKEQFGHTNVMSSHDKQHVHFRLNKWVQRQRKNYQNKCHVAAMGFKMNRKNGLMTDAQYARLSSIGFSFVAPKSLAIQKNRTDLEQRMAQLLVAAVATTTTRTNINHDSNACTLGETQDVETEDEEHCNSPDDSGKARSRNHASVAATTTAYGKKAGSSSDSRKRAPQRAATAATPGAAHAGHEICEENFASLLPNNSTTVNNQQVYGQKRAPPKRQVTLHAQHQNTKDDLKNNMGSETSRSNSRKRAAAPAKAYADSGGTITGPTRTSKKQKQTALLTRVALPADFYEWDVKLPPAPPLHAAPAPARVAHDDNDDDDDDGDGGHNGVDQDESTPLLNRRRDYRIKWEEQMKELEAYKATFDNIKVPKGKAEFKTIYNWMRKQRVQLHKFVNGENSLLDQRAVDRLVAVGIGGPDDKPPPMSWDQRFDDLREYKTRNGHCDVSKTEDFALGTWIQNQRLYHKRRRHADATGEWKPGASQMTDAKIAKLQEIGFFAQQHGHRRRKSKPVAK